MTLEQFILDGMLIILAVILFFFLCLALAGILIWLFERIDEINVLIHKKTNRND